MKQKMHAKNKWQRDSWDWNWISVSVYVLHQQYQVLKIIISNFRSFLVEFVPSRKQKEFFQSQNDTAIENESTSDDMALHVPCKRSNRKMEENRLYIIKYHRCFVNCLCIFRKCCLFRKICINRFGRSSVCSLPDYRRCESLICNHNCIFFTE